MTDKTRISPIVGGVVPRKSELDLDFNTGGELDVHQCIHSLLGGLDDVDESFAHRGVAGS